MAGTQHTPRLAHTQTAFVWRFLALSAGESQIIHVTAWTEREARNRCPSGCVAVFAAVFVRRCAMCNKTTPDAAAALTTLMHALIDISVIADRAHKHAARESECIFHYLAFVQLKADQALDKAGKIIMADVQEVHHA